MKNTAELRHNHANKLKIAYLRSLMICFSCALCGSDRLIYEFIYSARHSTRQQ